MHHHTRACDAGEQRRSWRALTYLILGHQAFFAGAILRAAVQEGVVAGQAIPHEH